MESTALPTSALLILPTHWRLELSKVLPLHWKPRIADQGLHPFRSSEENDVKDVGIGDFTNLVHHSIQSSRVGLGYAPIVPTRILDGRNLTCAMCGIKKENDCLLEDAKTIL